MKPKSLKRNEIKLSNLSKLSLYNLPTSFQRFFTLIWRIFLTYLKFEHKKFKVGVDGGGGIFI